MSTLAKVSQTQTPSRFPLAVALELGEALVRMLTPACEQILICGSVRRKAPQVKDVEIVAAPRTTTLLDLFGRPYGERNHLDVRLAELATEGHVLRGNKQGPRYSRWYVPLGDGRRLPIDLFVTAAAQWGAQVVIRTGPAPFSHRLVTSRAAGGAMPPGMYQADGRLWRGGEPLATPTEREWFAAIGVPYWWPEGRTLARLQAWLDKQSEGVQDAPAG